MQAHQETLKKYGHVRRPSYGKVMPISALLLDLSAPLNQRNYTTISKDGLSPKVETQPVVFTFGQGAPRYTDNIGSATTDFLSREKITGIAQRVESEEPKQPVFLKCTKYHRESDSTDESSDTDSSDTNSESDNEHESAESDDTDDVAAMPKTNDTPALLRQLSHVLCDDSCQDGQQRPSLSRSTSERQEFLASMLFNANAAVAHEPVLSMSNVANELKSKIGAAKPPEADIESIEELTQSGVQELDDDDIKAGAADNGQPEPIITEPEDSDGGGEVELVFHEHHFAPIDMGSNDTEPSDTDPFEIVPIITYPEEKFRVIGENEDLITFDDDNQPMAQPESQLTIENLAKFDREYFRNKLAVAEALAQATMLTPSAARRRLAARKMEMDINDPDFVYENGEYIPPKDLLLYLVRMGSFNSAPKIQNADTQDDCVEVPHHLASSIELVNHCRVMRGESLPDLLPRSFYSGSNFVAAVSADVTDGLRLLELNSVSKVCSMPAPTSAKQIRVLQWNILSQSLGQNNDNFVCCPDEALTWESRKYLIIQEIIQNDPDVICLQEVDHFKFLQSILRTQNYEGIFYPKPDSPCLYINENNGPDGCAIFYKTNKFDLIGHETRILEVWRIQSNQVAIAANLRVRESGQEFTVCTTHLKARHGALLAKLRNEQGKDLLKFVHSVADNRPVLMCGDFNAEPNEPIYSTIINNDLLKLSSGYADAMGDVNEADQQIFEQNGKIEQTNVSTSDTVEEPKGRAEEMARREPPFTTWKIREDGEVCHTIDYIFYSMDKLKIKNCLQFPHGSDIGKDRTPSFRYPSDHFSLLCDFEFNDDQQSDSDSTSH